MQMILHDKIRIQAEATAVLAILKKPELWPSFVDKIEHLNFVNGVYSGKIRMGSRVHDFIGTLVDTVDDHRVTLEVAFTNSQTAKSSLATIVYQVTARSSLTEVEEIIHYHGHLNFFIWLLIKCIHTFGRRVEPSNLENLQGLVSNKK
jgi:hypothetical protein